MFQLYLWYLCKHNKITLCRNNRHDRPGNCKQTYPTQYRTWVNKGKHKDNGGI